MTKEKNKFAEAVLGILTGITLWVIGQLISGRLAFVEYMELYETWILVFLFPPLFFGTCIWLAKYSAKNRTNAYFISAMIMFFVPVIAYVLAILLSLFENVFFVIDIIVAILSMLVTPALSIVYKMFECIDELGMSELASSIMILLVNLVPMTAGLVCSINIYKKQR